MRRITQLGSTVRLFVDYTDFETGAPVDPSTIAFHMRGPSGYIESAYYPDGTIVREEVGNFLVRYDPLAEGTHHFRFEAVIGPDSDVRDGTFDVDRNPNF